MVAQVTNLVEREGEDGKKVKQKVVLGGGKDMKKKKKKKEK